LFQAIASFPSPVIAALQGDALGAPFLAAALCDFLVCNEEASYGYTDPQAHLVPTTAVTEIFSERFGELLAQALLFGSAAMTGRQLREKGWTCPIVPAEQVEPHAQKLAASL